MQKTAKHRCAFVVMSTDSYEDVWPHFFYFKDRFWKDCELQTFLITESKIFASKSVETITKNQSNWSSVLKQGLMELPHDKVLLILDDMLLTQPVEPKKFYKALEFIEHNREIGCINLGGNDITRTSRPFTNSLFDEVPIDSPFRITTSPSIWHKSFLIDLLEGGESPWQFELLGTERSRLMTHKILKLKISSIFTFHTWIGNSAIIRGKWQYQALKFLAAHGQKPFDNTRKILFRSFPFMKPVLKMKRFLFSLSK